MSDRNKNSDSNETLVLMGLSCILKPANECRVQRGKALSPDLHGSSEVKGHPHAFCHAEMPKVDKLILSNQQLLFNS